MPQSPGPHSPSSYSPDQGLFSRLSFGETLRQHRLLLALIFLFWAAIYLPGLTSPALLDDADAVHAEAGKEMVTRGDWVTLHANGIRYLDKPPLPYWAMATMFKLFGFAEWQPRLPLALGALAAFYAVFFLGLRVFGAHGGFYSAMVLATAFGPYLFTRILIPDLVVGLWLTLGFIAFLQTLEDVRRSGDASRVACWGLAATAALNVLTKGLIGIAFPVGIILTFLFLTRNLRHLLRMRLLSSALVFFVIAAPWHIMAALRNPDQGAVRGWAWFYFINEQVYRYLNKREPHDYDKVPLLLFWGLLLLWLLPWCIYLFQSLRQVPVRQLRLRQILRLRQPPLALDRLSQANLLFAVWAAMILVFFSFSTRQEYYTLPALPALALLIGGWLSRFSAPAQPATALSPNQMVPSAPRSATIGAAILLVVGIAAFALCTALTLSSKAPPPGSDIADLLTKNPDQYALSLGHFFDLTPQALGMFRLPLFFTGFSLFLGSAAHFLLQRRRRFFASNLALALTMLVLLQCVHAGLLIFEPVLSSRALARAIQHDYLPGDVIFIDGEFEQGATLNFYTGVPVRTVNGPGANLWYGSRFPDAPRVNATHEEFQQLWSSPQRIFLWSDKRENPLLQGLPGYVFAHSGGKFILTNKLIAFGS